VKVTRPLLADSSADDFPKRCLRSDQFVVWVYLPGGRKDLVLFNRYFDAEIPSEAE